MLKRPGAGVVSPSYLHPSSVRVARIVSPPPPPHPVARTTVARSSPAVAEAAVFTCGNISGSPPWVKRGERPRLSCLEGRSSWTKPAYHPHSAASPPDTPYKAATSRGTERDLRWR